MKRQRNKTVIGKTSGGELLASREMVREIDEHGYDLALPAAGGRVPIVFMDNVGTWWWMGSRCVSVSGQVSVGVLARPERRELSFSDGVNRWVWVVDDLAYRVGKFQLPHPVGGRDAVWVYSERYGVQGLTSSESIARSMKWRGAGAVDAATRLKKWVIANMAKSETEKDRIADLLEVAEYIEPVKPEKPSLTLAEVIFKMDEMQKRLETLETLFGDML